MSSAVQAGFCLEVGHQQRSRAGINRVKPRLLPGLLITPLQGADFPAAATRDAAESDLRENFQDETGVERLEAFIDGRTSGKKMKLRLSNQRCSRDAAGSQQTRENGANK